MEHQWNDTDSGDGSTQRKPVPFPVCPKHIPRVLAWGRTRTSAVTGLIDFD
jgi:hypothetical protein